MQIRRSNNFEEDSISDVSGSAKEDNSVGLQECSNKRVELGRVQLKHPKFLTSFAFGCSLLMASKRMLKRLNSIWHR